MVCTIRYRTSIQWCRLNMFGQISEDAVDRLPESTQFNLPKRGTIIFSTYSYPLSTSLWLGQNKLARCACPEIGRSRRLTTNAYVHSWLFYSSTCIVSVRYDILHLLIGLVQFLLVLFVRPLSASSSCASCEWCAPCEAGLIRQISEDDVGLLPCPTYHS